MGKPYLAEGLVAVLAAGGTMSLILGDKIAQPVTEPIRRPAPRLPTSGTSSASPETHLCGLCKTGLRKHRKAGTSRRIPEKGKSPRRGSSGDASSGGTTIQWDVDRKRAKVGHGP